MIGGDDVDDHFYVCSNELLKSLDDGLDLRTAAAEYILAFENLDNTPSEPLYKSLKNTADIILKDEEDAATKEEEKKYTSIPKEKVISLHKLILTVSLQTMYGKTDYKHH